jgi:hypothetical protein
MVIAASAMSFLMPLLVKAGEAAAQKAGVAAWEKAKQIQAAIKRKLSGDTYAEETLKRVEEEPDSPERQAALKGVLAEKLKEDPAFSESLMQLLEEAKKTGTEQKIDQRVSVSGQGRIGGDVNQFGTVGGNVDLSKGKER